MKYKKGENGENNFLDADNVLANPERIQMTPINVKSDYQVTSYKRLHTSAIAICLICPFCRARF